MRSTVLLFALPLLVVACAEREKEAPPAPVSTSTNAVSTATGLKKFEGLPVMKPVTIADPNKAPAPGTAAPAAPTMSASNAPSPTPSAKTSAK